MTKAQRSTRVFCIDIDRGESRTELVGLLPRTALDLRAVMSGQLALDRNATLHQDPIALKHWRVSDAANGLALTVQRWLLSAGFSKKSAYFSYPPR